MESAMQKRSRRQRFETNSDPWRYNPDSMNNRAATSLYVPEPRTSSDDGGSRSTRASDNFLKLVTVPFNPQPRGSFMNLGNRLSLLPTYPPRPQSQYRYRPSSQFYRDNQIGRGFHHGKNGTRPRMHKNQREIMHNWRPPVSQSEASNEPSEPPLDAMSDILNRNAHHMRRFTTKKRFCKPDRVIDLPVIEQPQPSFHVYATKQVLEMTPQFQNLGLN